MNANQARQGNSSRSTVPDAPREWRDHDHIGEAVQQAADRLLEETGQVELAKQALDTAEARRERPALTREEFAEQLGYSSYLELFEASTALPTEEGQWLLTPSSTGRWVAWHTDQLGRQHEFATKEDAQQFVEQQAGRKAVPDNKSEEARHQG